MNRVSTSMHDRQQRKTHLTTFVCATLDAFPKYIHFLSHELLHLRIRNTWLRHNDDLVLLVERCET